MTQKRLDDLMQKSEQQSLSISDIGEICGALLESSSRHSRDLKNKLNSLEQTVIELKKEIQDLKDKSGLGFGVILEDEED
jgi:cell division protein FtsB